MNESTQFIFLSCIWIFSFISFYYLLKKSKYPNVGLGLIYFFNFSIIHFWGSVFFISPGYWNKDLEDTLVGFKYSTISIVCFFIGYLIYIKASNRNNDKYSSKQKIFIGSEPLLYFLIGIVALFVLKPILHGLPTITVFVSMGQQLMIVGLCLLLYKTYILRQNISFFFLLIFTALIPFITILTDGFLGTGLSMLITVLFFTTNYYRFNYRYILNIWIRNLFRTIFLSVLFKRQIRYTRFSLGRSRIF